MIESGLVEWIKSDTGGAGVNTAIGGRVYPIDAFQKEPTRPLIVYDVEASESLDCHDGPSAFTRSNVQLTIIADTYADCAGISVKLRTLLSAKKYTGSADVITSHFDDESDIEQPREAGTDRLVYVRTQTYRTMRRAA